jgi:hypothetical protein
VATAADVVTSVRAATGYLQANGPISDATILALANEEYPLVRRMVARVCPDLFATESGTLTVAEGSTEIDVSGVSSLDLIFEVKKLRGTVYRTVDVAGPDPEGSPALCWRRRGMTGSGTAVELYPVAEAPGTYKLRYMATAAALAGSGAVLLPPGAERILVESVAARVRARREEDPAVHLRERDRVLKEFTASLGTTNYVVRAR